MADNLHNPKRSYSADWLVQGVLTRIGDAFDRLTGRGWKPSSSLATSEVVERLKKLLDAEVRENGDRRKYVPHNIKLKMQWDKFSTDAEESMNKLREEMLTAAVDHINDKRYYTYAPLSVEVKPDYFTSGVKLFVSYDTFEEEHEAEMNVSIPGIKAPDLLPDSEQEQIGRTVMARFAINGEPIERKLEFVGSKRLSVGRTKENDLAVDDPSVSKYHASLLLSDEGRLLVADTGSTNGTFVGGERIAYGKAVMVSPGSDLMFGLVKVEFEILPLPESNPSSLPELPKTETYTVGEFEFTKKNDESPAETQPSIKAEDLRHPGSQGPASSKDELLS